MNVKTIAFVIAAGWTISAAAAGGINHDYAISGSTYAAPIQAFDDGERLYVQLRRFDRLPATMGADGDPVPFELKFPYMIMQKSDIVMLIDDTGGEAFVEKRDSGLSRIMRSVLSAFKDPVSPTPSLKKEAVKNEHVSPIKGDMTDFRGKYIEESDALSVKGNFGVVDPVVIPSVKMPIRDLVTDAEVAQIKSLGSPVLKVVSDGSSAGYKYARLVAMFAKKHSGINPEITENGAMPGYVNIE